MDYKQMYFNLMSQITIAERKKAKKEIDENFKKDNESVILNLEFFHDNEKTLKYLEVYEYNDSIRQFY